MTEYDPTNWTGAASSEQGGALATALSSSVRLTSAVNHRERMKRVFALKYNCAQLAAYTSRWREALIASIRGLADCSIKCLTFQVLCYTFSEFHRF